MAWDDAMERNLLLAVIMLENTSTKNWDKVKQMIGATDLTTSAVTQRFNKLKRECKMSVPEDEAGGGGDHGDQTTTPKKTPAKRGRKPKAESEKKRKAKEVVEDDEEASESLAKRIKGEEREEVDDEEV